MVYLGDLAAYRRTKGLDPDGRLINKAIADELVECLQAGPDGFIKGVTKSKKKMYNDCLYPYHPYKYWQVKPFLMIHRLYLIQRKNYTKEINYLSTF